MNPGLGPLTSVFCLAGSFLLASVVSIAALTATAGWPDTIDLLTQERSQAHACVALLKSSGDKPTVTQGRITYGAAKAAADGAIAGFTTALVLGFKPENLPRIQASLDRAGAGLQEVCDVAIKAAGASAGSKGVVDEIVSAAVGPVSDALKSAAGALWTRHREREKLEVETIKSQLDAAKWSEFGEE